MSSSTAVRSQVTSGVCFLQESTRCSSSSGPPRCSTPPVRRTLRFGVHDRHSRRRLGGRSVHPHGRDTVDGQSHDYAGESSDFMQTPLQMVVNEVEGGRMTPKIGRVFQLDDIVEAHRCMEDNAAGGRSSSSPDLTTTRRSK